MRRNQTIGGGDRLHLSLKSSDFTLVLGCERCGESHRLASRMQVDALADEVREFSRGHIGCAFDPVSP